jgi:hypothetical protein
VRSIPISSDIRHCGRRCCRGAGASRPVVHFIDCSQVIVIGTDTFETTGGAVLFTTSDVGLSDWLSPLIAADLSADSNLGLDSGAGFPLQIESTASLVPRVSEYQFLASQGPAYIVLGAAGLAVLGSAADVASDTTGGLAPDGSILDGTLTFDVFTENIVEQPVTPGAVPKPSALVSSLRVCWRSWFSRGRSRIPALPAGLKPDRPRRGAIPALSAQTPARNRRQIEKITPSPDGKLLELAAAELIRSGRREANYPVRAFAPE